MNKDKLKEIIRSHENWLFDKESGKRAVLRGENLYGADLSRVTLCNADFKDANLYGADLSNSDLNSADFRFADMRCTNLHNATLRNANLAYTRLSGANMRNADLDNSCLLKAKLRGANLQGISLQDARLTDASFDGKIIQIGPIGSRKAQMVYYVLEDRVQCGCWENFKGGTLEEFLNRINEMYPDGLKGSEVYRLEYLAAIELFKKMRAIELSKTMRAIVGK